MSHEHIARAVFGTPWYVLPEQLATIGEIVRTRMNGGHITDDEIRVRLETAAATNGPRNGGRVVGAVAVIPIYGTIMPRANFFSEYSGGATCTGILQAFRDSLADESIGSIVFDIDSPGGQVDGVEELSAEIRAARGTKPVVAVANTLMASAAYYIGAQADEIVASPSSKVGSIGCVTVHEERSRLNDLEGITVTVIRNPPAKAEGNPWEPLTDEARAHFQEITDDYMNQFVNAVAKGRGVSAAAVRAGYGQGRVLTAKRSVDAGLADRVGTLEDAIRRAAKGNVARSGGTGAVITTVEETDLPGEGWLPEVDESAYPPDAVALDPVRDTDTEAKAAVALARAKADRR